MVQQKKRTLTTRDIATIAILAAIASVLFMLEIPVVLFYRMDFSNLPVLLSTFALGPFAGTLTLLVKSVIGLLHSSSQGVGELADFLVGFAMLLPAGLIYRHGKTRGSAVRGMVLGTLCATVAGVLANVYLLIPFYGLVYGMPVETILDMGRSVIPGIRTVWEFVLLITAPFNVFKWTVLSVVCGLLYRPLSPILHDRHAHAASANTSAAIPPQGK